MKKRLCILAAAAMMLPLSAQKKTALSLFNEALECQQEKQWFEAVELYRQSLDQNPQYGDAWFNLAICSYALGSFDLAVEYCDKASVYSKNLSEIQNLKGMSLVALGRIDEAKKVFSDILKKFPNNIDARFGLAEMDLLDGKMSVAESRYQDALKRDETNRKALLSLALVSSEMGKTSAAEKYIEQALSYHSGEAEVHYMASYLAAKRGDYRDAEMRARSAVQIDGKFDSAYAILAQILYIQKRYEEVIDLCDFRIGRKRQIPDAWFLKGMAQQKTGRLRQAIETFETGLTIAPQDEIMRLALEHIITVNVSLEDYRRENWASYHFSKAAEYGRNFDGPAERYEYQRALSVAPSSQDIRQSFAEMLERDGLYELYVHQLRFIRDNRKETEEKPAVQKSEDSPRSEKSVTEIKNSDALEAYESMMINNIASRWSVDPFYLDKTRWNIGIYFTKKPVQLFHADLEEISAISAKEVFHGVASTSVDVLTEPVEGYGHAFRLARSENRDYFILLTAEETERTYSIDATIYSARTGTKTAEIHVYRTGNDCVARSLQRFRQGVLDILPIRGKVLRNVQGKLLLDLGKSDGVYKGAEFDIVKRGKVATKDSGPGVTYADKDLIGTVTVTEANEEISEGLFKKKGFYDTLNAEDEIILTKSGKDEEKKSPEGNSAMDTRPQADADGNASTEPAKSAEKKALKDSLKPSSRESDLIHLIRQIL